MPHILPKHFRVLLCVLGILFVRTEGSRAATEAMLGDASVQKAMADFKKKSYQAALNDLEPALQANPRDPEPINLKGAILTKLKRYDEALACYNKALQLSPGYFPARYNIGALLALREQWDPAIDYFRNLLIEQNNNELVQYKLLLLLIRRDADPALQAQLFDADLPTNTPAWYFAKAARLYKKGDPREAAKYIEVARNMYGDKIDLFQEELEESGLNPSR